MSDKIKMIVVGGIIAAITVGILYMGIGMQSVVNQFSNIP